MLLGRIRTDLSAPTHDGPRRRAPRTTSREGFAFIWTRPFFRVLMVWSALANLVVNALFFVAILRLIQGGFRPFQIGLVETPAGVFGILGAIAAPWIIDRFATGRLTVVVALELRPAGACRWCCGTTRSSWPLRCRSACCSTRPATPASAPTGSR